MNNPYIPQIFVIYEGTPHTRSNRLPIHAAEAFWCKAMTTYVCAPSFESHAVAEAFKFVKEVGVKPDFIAVDLAKKESIQQAAEVASVFREIGKDYIDRMFFGTLKHGKKQCAAFFQANALPMFSWSAIKDLDTVDGDALERQRNIIQKPESFLGWLWKNKPSGKQPGLHAHKHPAFDPKAWS